MAKDRSGRGEQRTKRINNPPLMSKFIIFSVILFVIVVAAGSVAFVVSMKQNIRANKGGELSRFLEFERLKLETYVNGEVSITLMIARSPLIRSYFANPGDEEVKNLVGEEMVAYRQTYSSNSFFWVNDKDRLFYFNDDAPYYVDETHPENYWYPMTLYETESYNFNINYNPDLNVMNLWINAPVFSDSGEPLGIVGTGVDLTELIDKTYKDHAESVDFFFFNAAGEITGASDIDLIAEKKNIAEELGYTGLDLKGSAAGLIPGETMAMEYSSGQAALIAVPLLDWYAIAVSPDSIRDFDPSVTALFFLVLLVLAIVLTVFNIFIARLIKPLRAAIDEADFANRAKSNFLSTMSHELRTPLNVIIGMTGLALEENIPESVRSNLESVNSAGGVLLSIVNDILDISKIESGNLALAPLRYDTPSLINDASILVNTYIGEKPIDFKLSIDENLPAELLGDEIRVKQIMNNLLSNAVKYSKSGVVELSVTCERETGSGPGSAAGGEGGSEDGFWMDIAVKDTGIGIRKEAMSKLFMDYYQADAAVNRVTEGTGLGLAITRRMAEMMEGNVTVESEYGKGSLFTVRIKQGYVSDAVIGGEVAENLRGFVYSDGKRQSSARLVRTSLSGARVLIVDDMQSNLDVAAGLMRKYDLLVDCVTSGQAAVDCIMSAQPVYDVVFMDHMMPDMDGAETTIAIREIGTRYAREIPIIALTANAVSGMKETLLNSGFQDFLSKPIDIMQLDLILKKWLKAYRAEETGAAQDQTFAIDSFEYETDQPAIDIPGVDAKMGIERYGYDSGIYLSVLRAFAETTPAVLEKLRLTAADALKECAIYAHGIKGSSGGIYAQQLRASAERLEMTAKAGDYAGAVKLAPQFLRDTENLVRSISEWFAGYDAQNEKPRQKAPDRTTLSKLLICCEEFDISGANKALRQLEGASYEEDGQLVTWLKEQIGQSEFGEAAARLKEYLVGK